jgi:hypothetical protein
MAGRWFSPGTPVSSTNKTDCHNITEILLKVALSTTNLINTGTYMYLYVIATKTGTYVFVSIINLPFIFSDLYSACFKSSKIQNQTIEF